MREARYEAVVAGGGPAGSAAALALVRGGRRVLLLDDAPPGAFRVGEAIPPAARPLLRDLGVLHRVEGGGHLPCYGNLSAWGSPELHETDFIFDPNGHGWHLDRAGFDAALRDAARDAGAEVREGVKLAAAARTEDGWCLTLSSAEGTAEAACGWVVDATGRRSAIARRHGAARVAADGLVAFFTRFRPAEAGDRDARTLIEAVPDGWWYTALVPSGERVVAFLTDGDLAGRDVLTGEGFVARLAGTEHVRGVLERHGYAPCALPRGADAGSARLDRFTGPGWLAAGDAATSFDPLSSQGIMTALYTGMKAGQALSAHLTGDDGALAAYVARLEEIHRVYMQNRTTYYAHERRWPERSFWRRRLEPSAAG
ncbi:MAG TPA: tryptophan 7-halogenase [Longimicrobium sp.]|nr:tryptophan 7-halogenase [Longimicrobium sp.]